MITYLQNPPRFLVADIKAKSCIQHKWMERRAKEKHRDLGNGQKEKHQRNGEKNEYNFGMAR